METTRDDTAPAPDRRTALRVGLAAALGTAAAAGCGSGSGPGSGSQKAAATALATPSTTPTPSTATASSASASAAAKLPVPPATELDHATSGRAQVALTFHGDGDPKLARALLSEAEKAGAHLTVLAVGRWLGEHPELAKRVLDGGHELGNHTENHADITRMTPAAAFAEIQACADRLRRLTGSPGRWFRPSQTQHADAMLVEQARRAGYPTVLSYDVDPLDYTDSPSSTTAHRFASAVRPGAVVSLHLGHPGTVAALPAMLEALRSRGLSAVTASELFA